MKIRNLDGSEFESDTPEKLVEAVALPPLQETGGFFANLLYMRFRKSNLKAKMARIEDQKFLEAYGNLWDAHAEQMFKFFLKYFSL